MAERTIRTDRFGSISVAQETIIELPDGLLGFVTLTSVALVPVDDDGVFTWLQSVDDPATAFLGVTPWTFFPDYQPVLGDLDQAALGLEEPGQAIVLCLVTGHDDPPRFTANLLGPVVINRDTRVGRQVVLDAELPTRAPLPLPR